MKRLRALRSDDEANALALKNVKLILKVAALHGAVGDPDETISRGWAGLYRAAQLFDPARKKKFSTCAVYWIRQELARATTAEVSTIHVPGYALDRTRRWRRDGGAPGAVVADALAVLGAARTGDAGVMAELPAGSPRPDDEAADNDEREELARRLAVLAPAEREAVTLRLGRGLETRDVAARLGVSPAEAAAMVERARRGLTVRDGKRCPMCREVKPRTAECFYRHRRRADGLESYCKPCKNAKRRQLQGTDAARERQQAYQSDPVVADRRREWHAAYHLLPETRRRRAERRSTPHGKLVRNRIMARLRARTAATEEARAKAVKLIEAYDREIERMKQARATRGAVA